jgi:HD-GYP domain-containing protein (c-di-GMP phosphodiesterase class II)
MSSEEALSRVQEGSGTEFDASVVEALTRAVQGRSLDLNLPDVAFPALAVDAETVSVA